MNVGKNISSYLFSTFTGEAYIWGMPVFISIEPASLCNLRCPECPAGTLELNRKSGFQTFEMFKDVIDSVGEDSLCLLLYFQGEAFMNPEIYRMITYARKLGLYVITSTNGHFFTESQQVDNLINSDLNSLIVSLDGTTQETYSHYRRGGSLDRVLNGVELIIKTRDSAKKRLPRVYFQFLVMRHNERQMEDARILTRKLGADKIFFKNVQVTHDENTLLIPTQEKYQRYNIAEDRLHVKGSIPNKCLRLWTGSVVTWNGAVVPCCFDKNADHAFGIAGDSVRFPDIWHSKPAGKFRRNVLTSRASIPMCANCHEGRNGIWQKVRRALNL